MTTYFDWDTVEDNIVEEFDDAGSTIANYTTEPYLYGDLLSQRRNGESRFFHFDGLGSTTEITDTAGTVTDTAEFSAFGDIVASGGVTIAPFLYIGKKGYYRSFSQETTVRRRVYTASRGRWLSLDVVAFPWPEWSASRLYGYATNRPTRYIDPSGLTCEEATACAKVKQMRSCDGIKASEKPDSKGLFGLTFCADGQVAKEIYPPVGDPDDINDKLRGDKCFKECVEAHEAYHEKQIATWCPKICECIKEDFGSGQYDVAYADEKTRRIWECPALRLTIQCMQAAIRRRDPDCDLDLISTKLFRTIVDYRRDCRDHGRESDRVPPIPEYPF